MRVFLLLALTGCGLFTRTETVYLPVEKSTPCLHDPLPELRPWKSTEEGCPEGFDVCLTPLDAAALRLNYNDLYKRVQDDWILCGEVTP